MAHAFTSSYESISNRLINIASIVVNNQSFSVKALWDTGATVTCISHNVVNNLNLITTGKTPISTPTGQDFVNTYLVDINLPNNVLIKDVRVCDSEIAKQGFDLLIGMDIINRGDFTVTNYQGKTIFSFIMPSQKVTDYAKQLDVQNITGKHGKGKRIKNKK